MNISRGFKFILLASISSLIIACGGHQPQKNTSLEQPPSLEIEKTINSPAVTETHINTGLNDAVRLVDTRLHLKQPYEQAWRTVATALEFNRIEISDRNQETGEYFVNYDPDNNQNKKTDLLDNIATFLFKDDYAKAAYKITVIQISRTVKIIAEKLAAIEMDSLEGDENIIFDDKVDDGADQLIHHLYRTLKNDLPLD